MIEAETKAPAKAKAKQAKRKPASPKINTVAQAAAPSEFDGMTPIACCGRCAPATGCIVTAEGTKCCGHPRKGGLQAADALNPVVVARFGRAKAFLAHQEIDKRD